MRLVFVDCETGGLDPARHDLLTVALVAWQDGTIGGAVLKRLGRIEAIRLDGHPTRAQLRAGVGKRGGPVSEHNVRVDHLCTQAGKRFMLARTAVTS